MVAKRNTSGKDVKRPMKGGRYSSPGVGAIGGGKGAGGMGPSRLSRNIGKVKGGYHGG